jgi:hypothetical protein
VAVCIGAKTWSHALNDAQAGDSIRPKSPQRQVRAQWLPLVEPVHFAAGAMSYLASPLWLALAIAAVAEVHRHAASGTVTYVGR